MNAIHRSAPLLAAVLAITLPSAALAEGMMARPGHVADHATEPRMSRGIRPLPKRLVPLDAPAGRNVCASLYRAAWTEDAMPVPERIAMRGAVARPAPATDMTPRAGARRNSACWNIVVLMADTHMHVPT